jgi:hypothetical protein
MFTIDKHRFMLYDIFLYKLIKKKIMNASFSVVRQYDSRGLPEFSMTEGEGGTIQVVYTHSHPKRPNNIGGLSLEKTQELLNKIQQDLNYFKQLLDSPNKILRSTVNRDIIDDLQLGEALYSRCLNLLRKSGINSQFEKAPDAIFGEIEALLNRASPSIPLYVGEATPAPPLDDKDEEESETNSWDFGFRLGTPKLPQRVERRGRKRKRPAVIFFPKNEKEIVEGEEQRLPTPRTPPQIPEPMATLPDQELATVPQQLPSSQVPTQIISENKFSPIPASLEPKRYSLKFPALSPLPQKPLLPGNFPSSFQPTDTQLQLPLILPPPKSKLTLASSPIFSLIFPQTQNPPSGIPLPTVPQPPAPTSLPFLQIDFMPSPIHFPKMGPGISGEKQQ